MFLQEGGTVLRKKVILLVGLLLLQFSSAFGEDLLDVNPAGQRKSIYSNDYHRLKNNWESSSGNGAAILDHTQSKEPDKARPEIRILVKKFEFNQSQILNGKELNKIVQKYEGKEISIHELYAIVDEINALYQTKNYITSRAVLLPQKVTQGIIRITLIEGRIGNISVKGNKDTNSDYIQKRISLRSGDLLAADNLENDIIFFNKTSDLQVQAELHPGTTLGTTDIVLHTYEPDHSGLVAFTDNAGQKSSGLYRKGLTWFDNSLTGNRDALSITEVKTTKMNGGEVSYYFPLDMRGSRGGISYEKNQTSTDFENYDLKNHEDDFALYFTHPLKVNKSEKLDGYVEFHKKSTGVDLAGLTLIDNQVRTTVAGTAYQYSSPDHMFYWKQYVTWGHLDVGTFSFTRYNFNAIYQKRLEQEKTFTLSINGQWANKNILPTSELFYLGGSYSTRGYPESFFSGVMGYSTTLEWTMPIKPNSKTRIAFFIDHGAVFNDQGNGVKLNQGEYLTSVGGGLLLNFSKDQAAKIYVGFPLQKTSTYAQPLRINFLFQSKLF